MVLVVHSLLTHGQKTSMNLVEQLYTTSEELTGIQQLKITTNSLYTAILFVQYLQIFLQLQINLLFLRHQTSRSWFLNNIEPPVIPGVFFIVLIFDFGRCPIWADMESAPTGPGYSLQFLMGLLNWNK